MFAMNILDTCSSGDDVGALGELLAQYFDKALFAFLQVCPVTHLVPVEEEVTEADETHSEIGLKHRRPFMFVVHYRSLDVEITKNN